MGGPLKDTQPEDRLDAEQLRHFADFKYLPQDVLAVILENVHIQQRNAGETVFECGDTDDMQLFLLLGSIKMIAKDGRELTLKSDSAAAQWPISRLRPRLYTAIATDLVKYFWVTADGLNALRRKYELVGPSIFEVNHEPQTTIHP